MALKITDIDLVDFHSHVLPNADHGSDSIETSLIQLRYALSHSINRICATPHFYPARHNVESFLKRRNSAYEKLIKDAKEPLPEIRLGAEVMICENIYKLDGLSELCLYGTKTILLELPFLHLGQKDRNAVLEVKDAGYDVVIAHADRYAPDFIDSLIESGLKVQLNAAGLCGLFKPHHLYRWMEQGVVVALGSDEHGPDEKPYICFDKAKKKIKNYALDICKKSDRIWNSTSTFEFLH